MKLSNEKIKIICIGIIFVIISLTNTVLATEFELVTNSEYESWNSLPLEEKSKQLMPRTSSTVVPENILNRYKNRSKRKYSMLDFGVNGITNLKDTLGASAQDSRYTLAYNLNLRVENQKDTNECWAFSTIKALETNIALSNYESSLENFSERHMDYATSQSFYDGTNEMGLEREAKDGGLPISGLAYLINGQGAVLEDNMPFENNYNKISINDIDQEVDTVVTDYIVFPNVVKKYVKNSSGNTTSVKYYDGSNNEYSAEELQAVRNMFKQHIISNGAIITMNGGNYSQYYNNKSNPFKATAYNCNDDSKIRDHAIAIVGWDDNYSKDNFAEGAKPLADGAYICLNSYGETSFDNGYIYVSYEDKFIEEEMYGITGSKKINFENIYQYDTFGGVFNIGTRSVSTGYIGTKFSRVAEEPEMLNYVGVTIPKYSTINIYVNPNGSDFDKNNLIKVDNEVNVLEPGYHRIRITPTELSSSEFSIVVEQTCQDNSFYFSVEGPQAGTAYKNVSSENKSFVSVNGTEWMNLNEINVGTIDTNKADVCIKAFTNLKSSEEPYEPIDPDEPINPDEQ